MPPNRTSSQRIFNTSLFEPEALAAPGGLQAALGLIRKVCCSDDFTIMEMVGGLNGRPHVLEYIFSILDNQAYERLSESIIAQFPTPTTSNVMEALGIKLLQRLTSSLTAVERVSTMEHCNELKEFRRKVGLSLDVLKELGGCTDPASTDRSVSPVNRKRPKARARHTQLNPQPFDCMRIAAPTTEREVRAVYGDILLQLQSILRHYLLVLRRPRVPSVFKHWLEDPETTTEPPECIVQMIRAGLYLESADGFGDWRVFLSAKAQKYLRKAIRDGDIFEIVLKKMKELSHGQFSNDNQKRLTGAKTTIPVYEAKMTGDTRLVYHIDCIPDGEGETQAIRVFGIFTHAQMDHESFWDTIGSQLQNKGPDYTSRCTFRNKPLNTGDYVIHPRSFSRSPIQEVQETVPLVKASEKDLKDIHSMLVLEKHVILSQALLNTIRADWEVPHVFAVSAQEQEIIENMSSCYVIGRSGTGKTTTMLFKMLGIECAWEQSSNMWDKPRQIFVTKSRVLATKVEEYFSQLMLSLKAASYSPEELQVMGMDMEKEMEFIDLDDIDQWRPDLPRKFSELTDENFPLFITYDQLCLLLQNDIGEDNDNDGFIIPMSPVISVAGGSLASPQSPRKSRIRRMSKSVFTPDYTEQGGEGFISYKHFLSQYWSHFPEGTKQGLDPALVFSEILGVIKGSEEAIGTQQRCLDRDTYLSHCGQGVLPETKEAIYDLFTAYIKIKRQHQEYDAADRTHHILKEFHDVGWIEEDKGKKVNFLYIDEVQDNLLIDTLVLRTLCNNPHGLFWAGDTAQTISIGSSFKFDDLKVFQYHIEKEFCHGSEPVEPKTYELVVNYRSHAGIVNCARSVIELLTLYWPHSIDILKPERASVDGPKPIFFSNQEDGDLEKSFFGDSKGDPVEFGADQCILVRDNDARQELKERLKERCIIMTLNECKGLEFNDVLLYNFFESSHATASQWRLVKRSDYDGTPVPDFNETKHASICMELKFLYVAITRARNKLWFLDSSKKANPMKDYWSNREQIQIWENTSKVPQFAEKSESKDWVATGKMMFSNKHYAQAMVAFKQAGSTQEANICYAFLLRESAREVPDNQVKERIDAFIKAGEAFSTCIEESKPHQSRQRLAYNANAAECFVQGHRFKEAGSCFVHAEQYSKAAHAFRQGGHFDEMAWVLEEYRDQIEANLYAQLTKIAQMNYFKHGKVKKAQKLFSSREDAITFAKDYGFDEARVELLHTSGKIMESAEVLMKSGKIAEAVKTLIATPRAPGHKRRAVEYLLTGFWQYQSFGVEHTTIDPGVVSELLTLAETLRNDMRQPEAREFSMFKARHKSDFQTLRSLHPKFLKEGNYSAALLCLDPIFVPTLPAQGAPTIDPGSELSFHLAYFELLDLLRREDCLDAGSVRQKVFAFQPRQDDRFSIPANSFLHTVLLSELDSTQEKDDPLVTHEELRRALDRAVPAFIYDRAKQQNNVYRRRLGATPCMMFVTGSGCRKADCRFQHLRPGEITVDWFNSRIQWVLKEIRILNLAGFHPKGVIMHWVCVLYSALHPPLSKFGSIATLDLESIPESTEGIRVLREWIWQACDGLLFSKKPRFEYIESFIPEFMPASMMAYDFDFERAQGYVPRTRMYRYEKWPQCLTRPGLHIKTQFIVRDFVQFLQGGQPHSLILGTLYLRQILTNRVPVEIGPFCDAVERLCGLYIAAHRFKTGRGSLHDVTLPSSWLIGLSSSFKALDKNTSHLPHFVNGTIELLRRLDSQRELSNAQPNHPNTQPNHPTTQPNHPTTQPNHPTTQPNHPNPQVGYPSPQAGHPDSRANHPNPQVNHPTPQANHSTPQASRPNPQAGHPSSQANHPDSRADYPTPQVNRPASQANYPTPQVSHPNPQVGHPNPQTGHPDSRTNHPDLRTNYPTPQVNRPAPQANHPNLQASHPNPQAGHPDPRTNHPNPQTSHQNTQANHPNPQVGHPDSRANHPDPQSNHPNSQTNVSYQFKYNGLNMGPLHASVYISRICLCLCLLGYNINDHRLKEVVVQAIRGLRKGERVNWAYRLYAEAPDWRGLVNVFTNSLSDSPFDKMIHLLHSKAGRFRGRVPPHAQTVKYENIEEIPDRLRGKTGTRRTDTRAPANLPPSLQTPEGQSTKPGNDDGQQKDPEQPEEDVLNSSGGDAPVDNSGQEEVTVSPEEIQAALKILAVYHRFMARKNEALKGIDATRARLWSLLRDRASSMEWPSHKQYRLLMQGPLVHVLVCLDGIKMFADQVNRDSKEQLKGDDHRKLEELMDRSDRSSDLWGAADGLQTRLGHLSSLHEHRDVSALKTAVLEVGRLVNRLSEFPIPAAEETNELIKEDWKLGWDGIVRGPVRDQKAERPKLTLNEKGL